MPHTFISSEKHPVLRADNDLEAASAHSIEPCSNSNYYEFTTYRTERVNVTSALWSGGDWHWRLTGPSGVILADCGGYHDEDQCFTVIAALRANARMAHLPSHH